MTSWVEEKPGVGVTCVLCVGFAIQTKVVVAPWGMDACKSTHNTVTDLHRETVEMCKKDKRLLCEHVSGGLHPCHFLCVFVTKYCLETRHTHKGFL